MTWAYLLEQVLVAMWTGVILLGQDSSTVYSALLHEWLWSGSLELFKAVPMELD